MNRRSIVLVSTLALSLIAPASVYAQGVIDGAGTVGYYTTIGLVLNVARTPSTDGGKAPKLPLFPH